MTKFLFCAPPGHGHVNPTLTIIKTMLAQGAEVVYFCTEKFAKAIQTTGATFKPYRSTNLTLSVNPNTYLESSSPTINECFYVFPQVLETARAEHIDCIVYDDICLWGRMLAEALHLPAIRLMTTYASNERFSYQSYTNKFRNTSIPTIIASEDMRASLTRFCKTYNINLFAYEDAFIHAEPLNIVFMPRAFQPMEETFDEQHFKFVGPPIRTEDSPTDFPLDQLSEQPVLYASRGTVLNGIAGIFDIILHAFGNQTQQLVLGVGSDIDPRVFGPLPDNVILHSQIPQLEVLRHSEIFITHCGMNGVMEALSNGIPMVAFPQSGEQSATAYRLQELKLGVAIDHNAITVHTLRTAVATLKNNPEYRANAQRMQTIIQKTHAAQDAAREILAYSSSIFANK